MEENRVVCLIWNTLKFLLRVNNENTDEATKGIFNSVGKVIDILECTFGDCFLDGTVLIQSFQ